MNESQKSKLAKLKKHKPDVKLAVVNGSFAQIKQQLLRLSKTIGVANEQNQYDSKALIEEVSKLQSLEPELKNLATLLTKLSEKEFPTPPDRIEVKGLAEGLDKVYKASQKPVMPDWFKPKVFQDLQKALVNIEQRINDNIIPGTQEASDFTPVRRVKRVGNRLIFDDESWGGGASGGSGLVNYIKNGEVTEVSAANPLPVDATIETGDIEIGAVEIKDGSSDNRGSVDSSGRQLTRITDTSGDAIELGNTTMASSLPVTLASNQTSIPVAATLGAETTKVIGTTRTADGSGNLIVSGAVSNVAAATGFMDIVPVGQYNATPPTITDTRYNSLQLDSAGNLKVTQATLIAGEDLTNSVMKVEGQFSYSAVATADVQIKASAGFLHTVTISCNDAAPTAGSVIIYDNTAESGTQVFSHTFTTTPFAAYSLRLDYKMLTGIYIGFTTTADVNVTVSYR